MAFSKTLMHEYAKKPIDRIYKHFMSACYNNTKKLSNHRFKRMGIQVCDEWKNDELAFIHWALEQGYEDGLTVRRMDEEGNFEPGNCYLVPISRHKQTYNRLYSEHHSMIQRCYYTKNKSYPRYGGRGVVVCDEWRKDKQAFFDWALANGYKDNLTIDRIDNSKGYSPDNCRWVTKRQQANNRRSNHLITANGETHTVSEWADITGIKVCTINSRIHDGWDEVKAVTTPTMTYGSWCKKERVDGRK